MTQGGGQCGEARDGVNLTGNVTDVLSCGGLNLGGGNGNTVQEGITPSGTTNHPRGSPVITAHGVELRIGARVLLHEATFQIAAGDRIGLVGRNGAGKTTLTKTLAGETLPPLSVERIDAILAAPYAAAGLHIFQRREMSLDEAIALPSTWARRLLHGRKRDVFWIEGTIVS